MKRLSMLVATTAGLVLSLAGTAFGQDSYPPVVEGEGGTAGGAGGAGEVAFTGASISLGLFIVAVLVVAGVTALMISRRRAALAAR